MSTTRYVRLVVKRDATGEFLTYDRQRFDVEWGITRNLCPSPARPLLATRTASYRHRPQLMLYRFPEGREWLGSATARRVQVKAPTAAERARLRPAAAAFEATTEGRAYTAIVTRTGFSLGVAERGTAGYSLLREPPAFATYEEAMAEASRRNQAVGLTDAEAFEIVADTMRRQNQGTRRAIERRRGWVCGTGSVADA